MDFNERSGSGRFFILEENFYVGCNSTNTDKFKRLYGTDFYIFIYRNAYIAHEIRPGANKDLGISYGSGL